MVKVVVAGGTGGLGRHIVEGIVATKRHDLVVLSRSSSFPELEALGVQVIAVDYANSTSLVAALKGVHTVISVLSSHDPNPQLALLDAAVKAGAKRFAPSEWVTRSIPNNPIDWYKTKWVVAEAVRKSGLEYTIFENGMFMNYLAVGTPGIGHLSPIKFIWDVENCTAQIPGDGSDYVVLTRTEDVGKFVAASLELKKWPEYSQMRGDRKTFNEVLKLARTVRGKPFDVTYVRGEKAEEIISTESTSSFAKFVAQSYIETLTTNYMGFAGSNLNQAFPQIQPIGVEAFLKEWWGNP